MGWDGMGWVFLFWWVGVLGMGWWACEMVEGLFWGMGWLFVLGDEERVVNINESIQRTTET